MDCVGFCAHLPYIHIFLSLIVIDIVPITIIDMCARAQPNLIVISNRGMSIHSTSSLQLYLKSSTLRQVFNPDKI